ncbi:MAG: Gfo/Idh/MocA family protein, partial [Candidatus Ratteibacteria bacterium]
KECEKIMKEVERSRRKFMVNFHQRWYPPIRKAKELVSNGKIGKPVAFYGRLSDQIKVPLEWIKWADKSGPEWFLLPHLIDDAIWILGQKPKSIFAFGKKGFLKSKGINCFDHIQTIIEFQDSIGSFESSWILPNSWRSLIEQKLTIYGTDGKIDVGADNEGVEISGEKFETPLIYDFLTDELPIEYFVYCVINGIEPEPGVEEGLIVTKVIESALKSIENKRCIKI